MSKSPFSKEDFFGSIVLKSEAVYESHIKFWTELIIQLAVAKINFQKFHQGLLSNNC
jgi:hypothetical protein